jgi:hypothetical protein
MENENQNPVVIETPVQEVQKVQPVPQVQQKKRHFTRNILIVLGIAVLGAVGYIGYTNPTLFTASITGGTAQAVTTDLYISTDYKANAGESDYIAVKAGKDLANLTSPLIVTFVAPSSMIQMVSVNTDGTALTGATPTTSSAVSGEFTVSFNSFTMIPAVSKDTVLFKILVSLNSSLNQGDTVIITSKAGIANSSLKEGPTPPITTARVPTFTDGKITIGTVGDACKTVTCGDHAACDQTTGTCTCFKGYSTKYLCNACDDGYTGFPNCKLDVLKNIIGVVLTLNNDALTSFSPAEHTKAYSSAYVMINSSAAVGKTITVESVSVLIPAYVPGTLAEVDKIKSITDNLKTAIGNIAGVTVAKVTTSTGEEIPGLLKLTASVGNADNSLDGITTNSGDVIIVPALESTITLLPTSSYQTRVIGKNSDGTILELNFNSITWMPQPVNRLSDTALKGGLLEKGDKGGVTPLYAEVKKADDTTIDSNNITVEVPAGPVIEYTHIIGSDPITRGGRVSLSVKVSDIDQISDIKDIRTSIVRPSDPAYVTYPEISNDTKAVWFTATPVISGVTTTNTGTQPSAGTTPATGSAPATPSTPSIPTAAENYRIYSIPVEIPQDVNMIDGAYTLLVQITDVAGHMATAVLPNLKIGAVATGDVDGDGKVTMLDVIAAFQIANGTNANPTQSQLQAADLDQNGKVTMLDVINLFNKINNQ